VIASISGVNIGLVVAEPTMSGIHDLKRALGLLNHFQVTPFVCINMCDINKENTEKIVKFCDRNEVEVAGEIPFDPLVTEAMVAGKNVVEHSPESAVSREIKSVWKRIQAALDE
jgi:MinD superfamily P-loop ATPase